MPGARRTRSLACRMKKAHERRHQQVRQDNPAFPAQLVLTAYNALSPVTGLFCHRRFCGNCFPRKLDTSAGVRTNTALPYALAPLVVRHHRVHCIPPQRWLTLRNAPLIEAGRRES